MAEYLVVARTETFEGDVREWEEEFPQREDADARAKELRAPDPEMESRTRAVVMTTEEYGKSIRELIECSECGRAEHSCSCGFSAQRERENG